MDGNRKFKNTVKTFRKTQFSAGIILFHARSVFASKSSDIGWLILAIRGAEISLKREFSYPKPL